MARSVTSRRAARSTSRSRASRASRSSGRSARSSTRRARTQRPRSGRTQPARTQPHRARSSTGRTSAARAPRDPRRRDVQAFFDRFTTCLTSGDGPGAAACFEYPALMVMADAQQYGQNQPLNEAGVVAEFFAKAPQMYHEKGVEQTFADVSDLEWLADDLCLVRAHFPYIDADGNDLGDGETSLYVVRRNDDGYAICAAIPLGTDADRARGRRRPRGDVGDQRA